RGGSYMPYYLTKIDYDSCNGLGVWSLAATFVTLTAATPMKSAMDFPIDLMVLEHPCPAICPIPWRRAIR
ncbi:hypothetical protein, partial [Pseudomonas indica]